MCKPIDDKATHDFLKGFAKNGCRFGKIELTPIEKFNIAKEQFLKGAEIYGKLKM